MTNLDHYKEDLKIYFKDMLQNNSLEVEKVLNEINSRYHFTYGASEEDSTTDCFIEWLSKEYAPKQIDGIAYDILDRLYNKHGYTHLTRYGGHILAIYETDVDITHYDIDNFIADIFNPIVLNMDITDRLSIKEILDTYEVID